MRKMYDTDSLAQHSLDFQTCAPDVNLDESYVSSLRFVGVGNVGMKFKEFRRLLSNTGRKSTRFRSSLCNT